MVPPDLTWQPTLLDGAAPGFDGAFSGLERIHLDAAAWVDFAPEWVSGSGEPFAQVSRSATGDSDRAACTTAGSSSRV